MKKLFRILGAIMISFLVINFYLNYSSPKMLVKSIEERLNKNKIMIALKLRSKKSNGLQLNNSLVSGASYIVKPARAKRRMVFFYKGKKLVITVDNPTENRVTKEDLEFFYKLELLRERNKIGK